jgi:hypothetical protein
LKEFSFSKSRNNRGLLHLNICPDAKTIKHIPTVLSDQQAKSTEKLEGEKGTNKDKILEAGLLPTHTDNHIYFYMILILDLSKFQGCICEVSVQQASVVHRHRHYLLNRRNSINGYFKRNS